MRNLEDLSLTTTPEQGPTAMPTSAAPAGAPTYSKVLVPVASNVDLRVVEVAVELARGLGAAVEVVSVVSPGLEAQDRIETTRQLEHIDFPISVRLIADNRDVADDLVTTLEGERVLMCLGTEARSALGEILFGSVAADVIRRCDVAVVVVGPHGASRFDRERIAIAFDGSQHSEYIIDPAADLAVALGLTPEIVEVITSSGLNDYTRRAELAYIRATTAAHRREREFAEPVLIAGLRVEDALIALSDRPDVAMLAMSTHGLGPFERLLSGSVTMRVIREARCPVLITSH